jgi:hypothetical protein
MNFMKPDTSKTETLNVPGNWNELFAPDRPKGYFLAEEILKSCKRKTKLKTFKKQLLNLSKTGRVDVVKASWKGRITNFYKIK